MKTTLREIESSCEKFSLVSTFLCPKYLKFYFQNLGNVRKGENGRRWTTFGFNNKNFETKSSLSTSVFMFSAISQILKTKFNVI